MLKKIIEAIFTKLAKIPMLKPRHCVACKRKIGKFIPYKRSNTTSSFLQVLNFVGSDMKNFSCPNCWCHDRERHLFLYMQETDFLNKIKGATVLHFAPEAWLSKVIANQSPLQYVKGDLHPSHESIEEINMLKIKYPDNFFDITIANHVLEHVSDDQQALAEIHRVIKPGGFAILQTPYCTKLKHTFSDPGIDDDKSRLEAYGQEDHVRLYGSDIFERFAAAGFTAQTRLHEQELKKYDPIKYGLNNEEPFFLFQKKPLNHQQITSK